MKRDFFIHFSFWLFFFVLISLVKHYLALGYWPFWLGGAVGVFMPDLDHLLYVLFLDPQDITSQRVGFLWGKKEYRRIVELLYETRSERRVLAFHTFFFQIIFLILTFFIMSSSPSLFGKGLVLSFALHLSVDQLVDLTDMKSLGNWTKSLPITLDLKKSKICWLVGVFLIIFMGFFM